MCHSYRLSPSNQASHTIFDNPISLKWFFYKGKKENLKMPACQTRCTVVTLQPDLRMVERLIWRLRTVYNSPFYIIFLRLNSLFGLININKIIVKTRPTGSNIGLIWEDNFTKMFTWNFLSGLRPFRFKDRMEYRVSLMGTSGLVDGHSCPILTWLGSYHNLL